jgi:hypothetical protein
MEGKRVRESNRRGWMGQSKVDSQRHWETPWNIYLNINNNKRQDCKIGTVWGGTCGMGKCEWRRLRWGYMMDWHHMLIINRTKKPLAIALNGAGRDWGGDPVG